MPTHIHHVRVVEWNLGLHATRIERLTKWVRMKKQRGNKKGIITFIMPNKKLDQLGEEQIMHLSPFLTSSWRCQSSPGR